MMYGNSVIGEAQHLEVFNRFIKFGRTLRNWFWSVQIHTREQSILSKSFEKEDVLYKQNQRALDTLIAKQEEGLVATPKVEMKPKQVARMKELRVLIDAYLNDLEKAKRSAFGR